MTDPLPWIPLENALILAREIGVTEAQASRGAFRTIANNPPVARGIYRLLNTFLNGGSLPIRLRELIVLRIAWSTHSAYEWFQHYRIATVQAGLLPEDTVALRNWRSSTRFSAGERAALAAVDETLADGHISERTWAECAQHLPTSSMLVEMVAAIGFWNMLSQFFRTFRVPLQEGAQPWPPDGVGPLALFAGRTTA